MRVKTSYLSSADNPAFKNDTRNEIIGHSTAIRLILGWEQKSGRIFFGAYRRCVHFGSLSDTGRWY